MAKTILWHEYRPKKNIKKDFEKCFFKLKNNKVFRKTMENIRKDRDIKLVETESGKNYFVSVINSHIFKWYMWYKTC